MNLKRYIAKFVSVFAITLLVTLGVTFLWSLISRGTARVDWETSLRFAMIFAIIIPIATSRRIRE
jgi:hypothetical protein